MKHFIVALTLVLIAADAVAQRSATCMINNFQRIGGVYSFDVWGRRTNATFPLFVGTSQFFFDYNSVGLSTPVLSNINTRFDGPADSTGDYLPMEIGIVAGKVVVTIWFLGNNLGVGQALSTTVPDGERICTISMTITNASQQANLTWDEINSAFTTTNLQPVIHLFIGEDEQPLPIQLASFTARAVSGVAVLLEWLTLSETNNYGFEIQRRLEIETEFLTLPNSFVPGHGTTLDPHEYSYTDSTVAVGNWSYRLKQIDLDGTVSYGPAVLVEMTTDVAEEVPTEYALLQNYPNPFNPSTKIEYHILRSGFVSLKIYNLLGQEVATVVQEELNPGSYEAMWDAADMPSGAYFYRLQAGEFTATKKLMLLR
jgi:hypothetical protein